jgi:predicted transcriptional regulator
MQITIGEYRIRRYDNLNLCVEQRKIKQKAKNPYGRNGKQDGSPIAQKNSSNKVEYKYHLICYSSTLDYCLKKLVEHCLTNDDEIKETKQIINKISELNEKINAISDQYGHAIEENILSNKADQEDCILTQADQIAEDCLG